MSIFILKKSVILFYHGAVNLFYNELCMATINVEREAVFSSRCVYSHLYMQIFLRCYIICKPTVFGLERL